VGHPSRVIRAWPGGVARDEAGIDSRRLADVMRAG
jgi:hypothetical protein